MKNIITAILIFSFPFSLFSQEREITKLWNSNLARKSEIQKNQLQISEIQKTVDSIIETNKVLNLELNLLKEKDKIRNDQLNKSLAIYGNSTSGISNKLDTLSVVIAVTALLLTLVGLALGFYIKKKEEDIRELLVRSNNNLNEQKKNQTEIEDRLKSSKEETEKLRNLIDKDLNQLYQKLKDEELKEMIENLNASPMQITNHVSRLITLNVPEDKFYIFIDMMFSWEKESNDARNIEYLLIFLINRFPQKMAANQSISHFIMRHRLIMRRTINPDKLTEFVDLYVKEFFNKKYKGINKELGIILNEIGMSYNQIYIAKEMLFEKYKNKEQRFRLLRLMLDEKVVETSFHYKKYMLSEYMDTGNLEQQDKLLNEIKETSKEATKNK